MIVLIAPSDESLILNLLSTRIEKKYEVTMLNGLNEFCVKFFGPKQSEWQAGAGVKV